MKNKILFYCKMKYGLFVCDKCINKYFKMAGSYDRKKQEIEELKQQLYCLHMYESMKLQK